MKAAALAVGLAGAGVAALGWLVTRSADRTIAAAGESFSLAIRAMAGPPLRCTCHAWPGEPHLRWCPVAEAEARSAGRAGTL